MATHDSMETTAGSLALVESKVPGDAHVVSLLRQAGAVIIGKANVSEWMAVRSEIASAGYSARGGQTRNPYDLSSSPCKSDPQREASSRLMLLESDPAPAPLSLSQPTWFHSPSERIQMDQSLALLL